MTEFIVEESQRLSKSLLWKLQEDAYSHFGIEAWSQHGVPSYITSNSFTARAYAQVALGYLRDCIQSDSIDLNHPLYLFDLGAGTGRFAYFFLKELLLLLERSPLPKISICYVMTDIVEGNLDYWQHHPYLKPYFDQGLLDCAYYHHAQQSPIHLVKQQVELTRLVNPSILICNYFFDTIPQDLFRFNNGHLEEGRITLFVENHEPEIENFSIINQLQVRYTFHPVENPKSYYEIPRLNALLDAYSTSMDGSPILFPIGAFQSLLMWKKWSPAGFLLLAGDQGVCTLDQMRQVGEPKPALHGSFSFPVSYHTLFSFFQQEKGTAWLTSMPDPAFVVMAGILGGKQTAETALAFKESLDQFEPTDYFKFVSCIENGWKSVPLEMILLLLKLGNWDGSILITFFSSIREALPHATEEEKKSLALTIDQVWNHFYPIGPETAHFVLNLGVLLFDLRRYEKAKLFFLRSLEISGPNEIALKNITACDKKLQSL